LLATPAIFTALIFHQVHLAESKGWPLSLVAGSFTVFAVASVSATLLAGPLVDRFGARRLVPLFLAPLVLSCAVLAFGDAAATAPLFLGLMGFGTGMSFVVGSALWPELYGTTHLGTIRAFTQAVMVFATGAAPAALGLAVDAGHSVESVALACAAYCLVASAMAALARAPRRLAAPG
jgi:MFS family permease